jgi:hypothetical protein
MKFKVGDKVRIIGYYSKSRGKLFKTDEGEISIPIQVRNHVRDRTIFKITELTPSKPYPYKLEGLDNDYPLHEEEIELAKITNWRDVIC